MSMNDYTYWTNDILKIQTPIQSWYAIHQIWWNSSEYRIKFEDISQCKPWYEIKMSAWVADEDWWVGLFHHRMYYSTPNLLENAWYINDEPYPIPETLKEKEIDWKIWRLQEIKWVIPKKIYWFHWYIWYNAEDPKDLYFTWVRLSCLPK